MQIVHKIVLVISSLIFALFPATTFREGVVGQPRSFFPHQKVTQTDRTISSLIYRSLFEYDIYGALVPDLVESWAISNEGLVYTITLKKDQKWSDGTEITADDLIYTSFKVSELRDVATDKVDDYTVRFTLPNKFSPFLGLLTIEVMQSNSEENYSALTPVSSGPFKVATIKRSGPIIKEVVLVNNNRDEEYKKLVFKYYTNEEELLTGAKLGEIDGFINSTTVELGNFVNKKFPLQGVYYALFFNLRDEKFGDVELRQKMEKVLNKEDITANQGILVQGAISRSDYTDPALEFDLYDKKFVKENLGTEIVLTIPDLQAHEDAAKRIKETWQNMLGLRVSIKKVPPENIIKETINKKDFEVLLYGQETTRDPDRYVNWHSTQKGESGLNLSGFEHVRADRALEEGRNEIDNDARLVHYHEFQKVIHEQVPAIFLYHPFVNYYVSSYVEGVGDKYTFTIADRFLDFKNWSPLKTN